MNNNTIFALVAVIVILGLGGVFFMNNPSDDTKSMQTEPPAASAAPVKTMTGETVPKNSQTIVEIAAANPDFSTLVTAVGAADLAATLSGPGPFTVFAPTNAAFAKLPAGTVESLLEDKTKLGSILTYHVIPGKVMAADVVKLKSATTVNGKDVTIKVVDGEVYVDNAKVITTDIVGSNGVIHVIDSVILP